MANKRVYKTKLKHWNIKPALDNRNDQEYSYRVLDMEGCLQHGASPSSDLLKYAIAKFCDEQFIEICGWFSSEQSAQDAVGKFPMKRRRNKKKFSRQRGGLNTVRG